MLNAACRLLAAAVYNGHYPVQHGLVPPLVPISAGSAAAAAAAVYSSAPGAGENYACAQHGHDDVIGASVLCSPSIDIGVFVLEPIL